MDRLEFETATADILALESNELVNKLNAEKQQDLRWVGECGVWGRVVWCGVVLLGVVWCGVVCGLVVWRGLIWWVARRGGRVVWCNADGIVVRSTRTAPRVGFGFGR